MALEELHDLKEVWTELAKVWEQIDQMKEQPWVSVQPRKVQNLLLSHIYLYYVIYTLTMEVFVCSFVRVWMLS